jgi:hypothetical protein
MKNTLKNLLVPVANPILSKVHRYKNAHKGESCYLIGDGISIKWFDLAAFSNKTAIPCAYIPFHNDFDKLSVQYLSFAEPWWFYPCERDPAITGPYKKNPRQIAYRDVISKYSDKTFFLNLSNYPVLSNKNIIYLFRDFNDKTLSKNFITYRINSFHGSLRSSISLAIYMGFDHVYLVGYDYTHSPSRALHWYEKGHGILFDHENYNKDFFDIAKEFIDITTITLDGKSNFIRSETYKEHTGRDPIYRENTDLVNREYLKILATWSGYSIF